MPKVSKLMKMIRSGADVKAMKKEWRACPCGSERERDFLKRVGCTVFTAYRLLGDRKRQRRRYDGAPINPYVKKHRAAPPDPARERELSAYRAAWEAKEKETKEYADRSRSLYGRDTNKGPSVRAVGI